MKWRLTRIARHLGYQATAEHWHTRADVYVEEPSFCLEVQLRQTQFATRTASRLNKTADVCWFIRDGLDQPSTRNAVFHRRGVRFRVLDRKTRKPITPWNSTTDDRDLQQRAVLEVFGTVAYAPPRGNELDPTAANPQNSWWTTGFMDGYQFLKEILAGQRRWYPAQTIGHKTGLWALETDVAAYREFRARQQAHLEQVHRERQAREPREGPKTRTTDANQSATTSTPSVDNRDTSMQASHAEPATVPLPKITQRPAITTPTHAVPASPPPRRWWQLWRALRRRRGSQ